jgi:hypothetical protein
MLLYARLSALRCASCRPSMKLAGVVSIIVVGLVLLVAGETDFDALGFILAMTAACLSGLRFTLTQVGGEGAAPAAQLVAQLSSRRAMDATRF